MFQVEENSISLSKEELLEEIERLKKRNAELEKLDAKHFHTDIKLNRIRNLLRVLIGSTKGLIVFKDSNLTYKIVNDAFCNFLEVTEKDIVGKTDYDLFPKNEAEINREGDLLVIKTKKPLIQNKLITGNGNREFLKIVKNPVYNEKGEFEGILVSGYDVTDAFEDKSIKLNESIKSILNNSNGVAALHSTNGTLIKADALGEDALKISTDNALDELRKRYDNQDGLKSSILNDTQELGEVYAERVIPLYPDKEVSVEIYTRLVDYKDSPAVFSMIQDISERKQAEKLLKKKVEEQAIILDNIEMQVWFLINASTYGIINKAHAEYWNKAKDEIEYKGYFEIFDKETAERMIQSNLKIFESKKQVRTQEWYPDSKGERRLLNLVKTPNLDMNGNVETILCTAEDITETYIAEEEIKKYIEELHETKDIMEEKAFELVQLNLKLEDSEEALSKLNASKDKFFSIIAHDLKSPFTALLGYTDILVQDFDELTNEEIQEFIGSLHETSRSVFQLLEGLLNWSRVQTGRMPYEPENFDVFELCLLVVKLFSRNAERKNIKLVNCIPESTIVFADKEMVNGVIRNLVSNAIKFTPAEGSITIETAEVGEFLEVKVCDTGVGISQADIEKLFKIDVHHTTKGTENEMGTGVGLILCKELVEKNGGSIWVTSEANVGTNFIFTLPKAK
ncbi:MAG: PAS domain-containing protein [Bacteroidetes bacterium]|nr:PAS domain-containing protein [Bacteroidota bacterium]